MKFLRCINCDGENIRIFGFYNNNNSIKSKCLDCGLHSPNPAQVEKREYPEVYYSNEKKEY